MAAERRFSIVAVKLLLWQISGLQSFSEAGGGFGDVSAWSILPLPFALGWRILSSLVLRLDFGLCADECRDISFSFSDGRRSMCVQRLICAMDGDSWCWIL
jgi:hypothetical protein